MDVSMVRWRMHDLIVTPDESIFSYVMLNNWPNMQLTGSWDVDLLLVLTLI